MEIHVGEVGDMWSGHEEKTLSIREDDRMEDCLLEAKSEHI